MSELLQLGTDEVTVIARHQIIKKFPGTSRVQCLCGVTVGGGWEWAEHVVMMLREPRLAAVSGNEGAP